MGSEVEHFPVDEQLEEFCGNKNQVNGRLTDFADQKQSVEIVEIDEACDQGGERDAGVDHAELRTAGWNNLLGLFNLLGFGSHSMGGGVYEQD